MQQVHTKPIELETRTRVNNSIVLTLSKEDAESLCEAINSSSLPIKRDLGNVLYKLKSLI